MSMVIFWSLLIFVFSFLLVRIADFVVHSLRKFSLEFSSSAFSVSAVLVALGSCLPEIVVAVTSALENKSSLSVGNIIGSSVANISFLVGFVAVVFGKVGVNAPFFKHDLKFVFLSLGIFLLLAIDDTLSKLDGVILLFSYLFYLKVFLAQSGREKHLSFGRHLFVPHFPEGYIFDFKFWEEIARIVLGFGGLLFSAWIIVKAAIELTSFLDFSFFAVGFILIAFSTMLPELAFSIRAIRDRENSMFLGGVLGSIIANFSLVVGVIALLSSNKIVIFDSYLRSLLAFLLLFILFGSLVGHKSSFSRKGGFVLLFLYFSFLFLEFF